MVELSFRYAHLKRKRLITTRARSLACGNFHSESNKKDRLRRFYVQSQRNKIPRTYFFSFLSRRRMFFVRSFLYAERSFQPGHVFSLSVYVRTTMRVVLLEHPKDRRNSRRGNNVRSFFEPTIFEYF